MPNEPSQAVMAPGSRTWQILRTVADGLAACGEDLERITVIALDEAPRSNPADAGEREFVVTAGGRKIGVDLRPMPYQDFISLANDDPGDAALPSDIRAVIATGSAQPYSTAARFARRKGLPLWVDVFGDPLCELQSQLELMADADAQQLNDRHVHVWKLLLDGLLEGDQYYGLSQRQRHALQGQLGCAGRLNQFTASKSICHYLPYAVYEDDAPAAPRASAGNEFFTVMWCGSFNTWMDVPTLTRGITDALESNPNMRLLVVGGRIPGYNEISYNEFLSGIRQAGVEGAVRLMDWQPLSAMQKLYAQCDLGLSIDRFTYEAELGSRTRLINFMAAGLPVASTVVTELSEQLVRDGMQLKFELGNAKSLSAVLLKAAESAEVKALRDGRCRDYVMQNFNAAKWGAELRQWVANPTLSPDKPSRGKRENTNMLLNHWTQVREPLGL